MTTLFIACLGTETNSFSPMPTGIGLYESTMLIRDGQYDASAFALPLAVWGENARALGWKVATGTAAFAMPAGNTTRPVYESLRDEILGQLKSAMPVDAVLLNLHGAMIADGYPDAEGDFLAHVREIVGPEVFIGAELDLHCHLTALKVSSASVLMIYKEYPHVDIAARAEELFSIAERSLAGKIRPVMAIHDCRMLGVFPTTAEPMRGFVDRMSALERSEGILSVSLAHGFPWGDTPEVGVRSLVVADGDIGKATALAESLGREVWSLRNEITPRFLSIDEAATRVLAHNGTMPLVLADTADNPGIGAGGDATFLIRRFLELTGGGFAVSPFWDPIATDIAFGAGVGATLDMRLGGKLGPASGTPLDLRVVVKGLVEGKHQRFGDAVAPLGRMAWLRVASTGGEEAVDIIINDYRTQGFSPDCFSAVGLDPASKRALVVKSTQHFHARFASITAEVLYVAAPGTGSMDMTALTFKNVTRPLWPRVADPHGGNWAQ
ncbi:MAG: M81 family metallopeptidase [Burkholderiales bacterium]|jgi:microcystin degradation protein MlrC|nr:M81 family metallopeptidase [Betaproteobacteria bacterium]